MKPGLLAFVAACAVTLVVSCASAPRAAPPAAAAPPLTIELFDSHAVLAEPPAVVALLDLPVVPQEPAPLAAAAAPPAAGVMPSRSETPPLTAQDASLRSPMRPARPMSFQLASPVVPPAAAVIAKPAPAKPAAPKPAAAKPTPPKPAAPSSVTAPAPKGLAASPAPGSSPSAAGTASQASTATSAGSNGPAPYGRLREIYARQGDELQIGLDGVGFLFLGLADSQADGMSFKSKENRANRTLFTFQALKLGTYDLDFLQQDNMSGKSSRETVRVHVVSDQDFAAATAGQPAGDVATSTGDAGQGGDPAFAQKLAAAGSYPAAVAELLKGYKEGNPSLNDQIAALYLKMGSYDAAEKYWSRNLQPQTDFTPRAVVGLFRVSVLQNDQPGLLSNLRSFLAQSDPSMEEPLVQAVRMEKSRLEVGIALDLAGEYQKRFPDGSWRDEVDFLTAQLLEADSQFRDIARARQLYQAILTDRPESPYADRARLRIQYIDRHFFQVR